MIFELASSSPFSGFCFVKALVMTLKLKLLRLEKKLVLIEALNCVKKEPCLGCVFLLSLFCSLRLSVSA